MPSPQISTTPFRPSLLRIPSGPASPALPLTPPASRPTSPPSMKRERPTSPPPQPLPWLWTCHLCDSTYSLGVTRRCLHDGHVFCSGTTRNKTTGVTRRHRSCNSEFDYIGWSEWQHWRRETLQKEEASGTDKDCWHQCDYPSECRWGHKIGLKSEKPQTTVEVEKRAKVSRSPKVEDFKSTTNDNIVEQVVLAVQQKSKGSGLRLSPIKEEITNEILSPTSPLRQHYQLPPLETFDDVDTDHEETPHTTVIGLAISPSEYDAGIADAMPSESTSPPVPDWMDVESDEESTPETTPEPELGNWITPSFDFASAKSVLTRGLTFPGRGGKTVARKLRCDSGYASIDGDEFDEEKAYEVEILER
ncbi:MAG: hypothetical protein M1817_002072 [Caeruleum heppii]|nr:MAG: hypothetical protein M1817_002072 [Caeruleum heppii]